MEQGREHKLRRAGNLKSVRSNGHGAADQLPVGERRRLHAGVAVKAVGDRVGVDADAGDRCCRMETAAAMA
jgi:hypothetical protein